MIKILIIEDEKPISNLIKLSLTKAGNQCKCAFDSMQAADYLESNEYDLILLDIMLPKVDGYELMNYIQGMEIPVIFITAKNSVNDRVKGLRMGAEDYIVKPFEIVELLAWIEVILRRYQKADKIFNIDGLTIDTVSMCVMKDKQPIQLTSKEYELPYIITSRYDSKFFYIGFVSGCT